MVQQSALIVEVPDVEHFVAPWRLAHDPVAEHGVPGHITALFPFVAPAELTPATIERVARVAASIEVIRFEFRGLDEFPSALFLRPMPDEAFRSLTLALWREFPDHPPYGGRYPDSQPHLTLAMADSGPVRDELRLRIEDDLRPHLPVWCTAGSLSVYASDDSGEWTVRHRLPFAGTS